MKVVEVIPSLYHRAGAETFFFNLCKSISKHNDVELTVIFLYNDMHESFASLYEYKNIKIFTLNKKSGLDFKTASDFKKIIKKIKPDIINTHLECLSTYFLSFGLKKRHWKIFHTCHNIASRETSKANIFLRKLLLRHKLVTHIAISDSIEVTLKELYGNKYVVPIIYNGIPLRDISSSEPNITLINCARFCEQKNQQFLVDAVKRYNAETNSNVNLLILGDGPLYEQISKQAIDCPFIKLSHAVNDIYPYLCDSKIFVLTSIFEGNPISILEAMNCGLAILSSKVGGIPDVVSHKENGYLFNVNDYNDFKEGLTYLLNEENYKIISKNNKNKINKYSIDNCSEQYLKLFKDFLSK